jgi:hypothetical protein
MDEPRNPHVHHEPGDVNALALTKFGLTMTGLIVVFMFALAGLFTYFKAREAKLGLAPSPVARARQLPPEPRLQPNPTLELEQVRAAEDQILHQYAWIDPDKGIVRIPVERAMELIAHRGLPPGSKP